MRALALALSIVLLAQAAARAAPEDDEQARARYEAGKVAYERKDYAAAYEQFRRAYLISQRPELLFNMSSALQRLDRPHEAAESLRAYLRVVPDEPDRVSIGERIRALEEKQRLLDEERARATPSVPAATAVAVPRPGRTPIYKRWWLWTVVGLALAGAAVGIGVGVWRAGATSYPSYPASDGMVHF
jgi:tetratricopeptide (TPR) repeat protein